MDMGERDAAQVAIDAAKENDATFWREKAEAHSTADELAEAMVAWDRELELLRREDAPPPGELRHAEKSARDARQRVNGRLSSLLLGLRGISPAEIEPAVLKAAGRAQEDTVVAAWRQVLQREVRAASAESWFNVCAALREDVWHERALCLELAFAGYQAVLRVLTRQAHPEQWATTQHNLAAAYSDRIRGERAANVEAAIEGYEAVLEVHTRQAYPEDWAMTQHNLANAYSDRICGERAANVEAAIERYKAALEVRTRQAYPEDWATTQNNLATAYVDRVRGDRAANVEAAIERYKAALEVYTRQAYPEQWATTQNNLAAAEEFRSTSLSGEKQDKQPTAIP